MSKLILSIFVLFNSLLMYSQNKLDKEVFIFTDKELSTGDSNLYHGKIHQNRDICINNQHRYLFENIAYTSDIVYDSQTYFSNKVKYDINQDILVINPNNQSEKLYVELSTSNVDSFTINNKRFVKLNFLNTDSYYEENLKSDNFNFYIKYLKKATEILTDNGVRISYDLEINYFIKKDSSLKQINSKRSLINLFPELKLEINEYYKAYDKLEKENNIKFMENLILKIKNLQK